MKAIEAFPISEEEAMDLDELKVTFPSTADLRTAVEDYFHIYDDSAQMSPEEFDMYFADFIRDDGELKNDSITNAYYSNKPRLNKDPYQQGYVAAKEEKSTLDNPYSDPTSHHYRKWEEGFNNAKGKEHLELNNSSRKVVKSARTPSPFKIDRVKLSRSWLYETYKGGLTIEAEINGVHLRFPFSAARWGSPLDAGIDCNEAITIDNKQIKISDGGGQTHYALDISPSILTSKPKQNQKDYRFTGQYYSTAPVATAFKKALKELYETNQLTEEFLKVIGLGNGVSEQAVTSSLNQTEIQTFKETLIRAGYTEDEAQQILDQVEAQGNEQQSISGETPLVNEYKKGDEIIFYKNEDSKRPTKGVVDHISEYGRPVVYIKRNKNYKVRDDGEAYNGYFIQLHPEQIVESKLIKSFRDSKRSIEDIVTQYSNWSGSNMEPSCRNCAEELKDNGYTKSEVKAFFDNEGYYDEETGEGVWDKDFANCILSYLPKVVKSSKDGKKKLRDRIKEKLYSLGHDIPDEEYKALTEGTPVEDYSNTTKQEELDKLLGIKSSVDYNETCDIYCVYDDEQGGERDGDARYKNLPFEKVDEVVKEIVNDFLAKKLKGSYLWSPVDCFDYDNDEVTTLSKDEYTALEDKTSCSVNKLTIKVYPNDSEDVLGCIVYGDGKIKRNDFDF